MQTPDPPAPELGRKSRDGYTITPPPKVAPLQLNELVNLLAGRFSAAMASLDLAVRFIQGAKGSRIDRDLDDLINQVRHISSTIEDIDVLEQLRVALHSEVMDQQIECEDCPYRLSHTDNYPIGDTSFDDCKYDCKYSIEPDGCPVIQAAGLVNG